MSESLKQEVTKGIFWSGIERFSVQGVQFLVMIVMARILMPEDYGLVGMLTIFLAVSQSLIDSGFTQALIRKQNRTEIDNNTVFYFNIVVGFILYFVLYLLAPYVSKFYAIPELTLVMRVISLSVVLNSFTIVQRALFTAQVNFKSQAQSSLVAAIVSGVIGIVLAYRNWGVWSLVVQQLINQGTNAIMLWILSKWHPRLLYSWKSFKDMFSFGSKLMLSGLLNTIYENVYALVIGKIFNANSLGNYTRAHQFANFPSANLTGILQKVTYPVLCGINEDDRLRIVYRKFLKLSAYIVFPLMLGLSALSHPFVELMIGEQWGLCSSVLQILCFSMMWYPIHSINLNLLNVKGFSGLILKLEFMKKLIAIVILCITIPFGIIIMCYGQVLFSLIALIINTYYTSKLINMGFISQMKDLLPIFLLSFIMFMLVSMSVLLIESNFLQLVVGFIVGSIIYVGMSFLFHFEEYHELLYMIKKKKQ